MGIRAEKRRDLEDERKRIIDEMAAENGPKWMDKYKPGSFGCHELLDRTAQAAEMIERVVVSHPACAQNREWYALAEKAASALHELYQRIGAQHVGHSENGADDL